MPCGFARPRWQVRLRESVPWGEGTQAGANATGHGDRQGGQRWTVRVALGT